MLKMVLLLTHLFFLFSLGFTVEGQESVFHVLTIHHDSTPETLQPISHTVGVYVSPQNLNEVSSSVLTAEKWVKNHVLSHYPSTNITSIIVAHNLLCNKNPQQPDSNNLNSFPLLPSMKNIHHSLTRWGLEREIKVSAFLSSDRLQQPLDFSHSYIKPILHFLQDINSTITVKNPQPHLSTFLKDLGIFHINKINVMVQTKPTSRKLSFIDPFYSVPSDAAKSPLPPLIGVVSSPPPSLSLSISPELPPSFGPMSSPPYPFNLPPCNPSPMAAPPPVGGGKPGAREGMWCVAKPSVPSEKLQEALDYACGEGGADCAAIAPSGSCYSPDSVVAHASYAFNSYWQKSKRTGGTCGFGGTAMLISSDPSFLHCHFILS